MSPRGDGDVWLLYRTREFPRVGDFSTEEAAQEFADEHLLTDYKPLKVKTAVTLFDGQEHRQICSACEEEWPCRVERLERKARSLVVHDSHRCSKCGKQVSWIKITMPGGGLLGDDALYCGKLGACRTFALKELQRLGHDELHAKAEAEREMRSRHLAERKAAKAERRRVWVAGMQAVKQEEAR